ncbi:conjugal transfer protein TraH [Parasulfuritortus cantonensis]|uniref:Conjugal transfer protein TraH n=1 Tax=Parasulfuritortus cantonensis TaxID=2528202 RepID=A0A4R1BQY7_9PROT|nr:conjugal transfer protein TraH [Parasulfuritortus cantonensis]TCJ20163.1 conjugal transfer protein TraH [Parasulfuritortus cantonensis]
MTMKNIHWKPLALAIALLSVPSLSSGESLQAQAETMFNGMTNTTAPQAFKGQTMNTYTMGSMFTRVPNKTYQLLSVQAPYIRAGNSCGGIDAFGGSFSHISSEQFKNMLKNITSAIPGVLFQLAIKSVEPLLGDTMQWFKSIENIVNRASISSCEGAKMALNEANQLLGFSTAKTCESIATTLGISSDAADAREKCASSSDVDSVLDAGADNDQTKALVPFFGNIVWHALKRMEHLDDEDRELIMSITGTTIYSRATDGKEDPRPIEATDLNVAALLRGDAEVDADGNSTIKMLSCGGDTDDCLNPVVVNQPFRPLTERVRALMASLADKIASRGTPTVAEVNFVNNVPAPVYRMLAIAGSTRDNDVVSQAIREQYNDYVAVEYAYALLYRAAHEALTVGLHGSQYKPSQFEQLQIHAGRAQSFLTGLNSERQTAAAKAQAAVSIITHVAQLERDLRAAMPQQVLDLLAYSAFDR